MRTSISCANAILLLLILLVVVASSSSSSVVFAATIEFARSSSSTSFADVLYSPSTSYFSLFALTDTSDGWRRVCYDSTTLNTVTAQSICKMIGLSTTSAGWRSYSSAVGTYGFTSLSCVSQSGNGTNFDQCGYDSNFGRCPSDRIAQLRCGSSYLTTGGTHGQLVATSAFSSLPSTTLPYGIFMRQIWNGQVQTRRPFSTSWVNMYSSSQDYLTYLNSVNLCYWTRGFAPWTGDYRFVDYTTQMTRPGTNVIVNQENGADLGDLKCGSTSSSLYACGFSFASDTTPGLDYSSLAVSLECNGAQSTGRNIGNGFAIKFFTTDSYQIVNIGFAPFDQDNMFNNFGSICTGYRGSVTEDTATALCKMGGFGKGVVAHPSSTSSSLVNAARFTSVSCPSNAMKLVDCSVQASFQSYCEWGNYLTIWCDTSGATWSPSGGSANNGGSPPSSGGDPPSNFNPAAVVVPIFFVVFLGISFFRYMKSKQMAAANANNNAFSTISVSSTSINSNFNNNDFTNSSSPYTTASTMNNNNNMVFMMPMTPMNDMSSSSPPQTTTQAQDTTTSSTGMTTVQNLEYAPPPPPSTYNPGCIPGFGNFSVPQT